MDTLAQYGIRIGEIGARILLWNPESCVIMAGFLIAVCVWAHVKAFSGK